MTMCTDSASSNAPSSATTLSVPRSLRSTATSRRMLSTCAACLSGVKPGASRRLGMDLAANSVPERLSVTTRT